jgi:hypothetical protein
MTSEFQYIIPIPPPPPIDEMIATHQVSREFYREVHYRQDFQRYCQWYRETAAANRRDLERMKGELNILGWFFRKR